MKEKQKKQNNLSKKRKITVNRVPGPLIIPPRYISSPASSKVVSAPNTGISDMRAPNLDSYL